MKLQKQEGPECILATIAMLADKPIELIRRRACGKLGIPAWTDHERRVPNSKLYWKAVNYLIRFYDLQAMVYIGGEGDNVMATSEIRARTHQAMLDKPIDFQGKGQIIFHHYSFLGNDIGCHSVAMENGLVYDGNMDNPIPLKEYWGLMWNHYSPGHDGPIELITSMKVKG